MPPVPDSNRLQCVFDNARRWQFYPHPAGNLKDLLAFLSVAAGIRQAAAFGFHDLSSEGFARGLKDKVANLGFRTLITGPIRNQRGLGLERIDDAILEVIRIEDEERFQRNKTSLLWVFSDPESRNRILEVIKGNEGAGILLGYPPCCVEHNRTLGRTGDQAFFEAIVKAVGNDPEKVLKALREDLKVEIENCAWDADNAVRTDIKFPFLLHIACDACLDCDDSPSAHLNVQLQMLAQEVGHGFADTVRRVTQLDAERMQLINDCERKGFGPDTIDEATRERLREMDKRMDQICTEFENGEP